MPYSLQVFELQREKKRAAVLRILHNMTIAALQREKNGEAIRRILGSEARSKPK